jgi:hypothetical protein
VALIRASEHTGFVRRLVRIYREKRGLVPVKERYYDKVLEQYGMATAYRRMPRWAAWQIAWRQARNAYGLGTQE